MDVLQRLTNKDALEKAFEAKSAKLTVIDAEELLIQAQVARHRPGRRDRSDRAHAAPALCGTAAE